MRPYFTQASIILWTLSQRWVMVIVSYLRRYRMVLSLFALALLTRLPLLSTSLDEVDAANFYNALAYGYNIPWMRPHPPGSPVYVFMGWLLNGVIGDPLLSLTLLSAVLGSLAVFPFHSLLRDIAGAKLARVGSLFFIVNPLLWSFSEAALSDVPSMFSAVLLAWLCYRARFSNGAFLWACVVSSLAIGVRQPNLALLLLLAFPLGYRVLAAKERPWRLGALGANLFLITTLAWFVPAVALGSSGLPEYLQAVSKQWSTAVRIYDFTQVESPWLPRFLYRAERFSLGYFLSYAWTGGDDKTPIALALMAPWLFGFGFFVTGFRFRDPRHVFLALWVVSIIYSILVIHFLPRYALPQLPGFIIACLLGYRFLGDTLLSHPRRLEILPLLGIGCVLALFAIKQQPPVDTFEYSPTGVGLYPGLLLMGALPFFLGAWLLYRRPTPEQPAPPRGTAYQGSRSGLVVAALALLVIPYVAQGYSVASMAHRTPSPSQQLVEYVKANFETNRITPCWDNQTHSFFEAVTPEATPVGYWSLAELRAAYNAGHTLLVSDRCPRYQEIKDAFGLVEVSVFSGDSPLWAKTPSIRLYATPHP